MCSSCQFRCRSPVYSDALASPAAIYHASVSHCVHTVRYHCIAPLARLTVSTTIFRRPSSPRFRVHSSFRRPKSNCWRLCKPWIWGDPQSVSLAHCRTRRGVSWRVTGYLPSRGGNMDTKGKIDARAHGNSEHWRMACRGGSWG